ncbi:MAG: hypothetical protein D6800_06420 [Candidatus Zixiibacteriota bacterium]|nr:MAG: hypothetical protein D6800_06420 [candidate division Zixibacteria bacterium]
MMRTTVCIMFCLATITGSGASQQEVRILTPPEHVSVQTNSLHVVGSSGAQQVRVLVNGVPAVTVPVRDSLFHATVSFGYGLNEIAVETVAPDSSDSLVGRDEIEVLYGPYENRKIEKIYPRYAFHDSEEEKLCAGCHDTHVSGAAGTDDVSRCVDCHVALRNSFRRHIRSDSVGCALCHDGVTPLRPAGSQSEYLCFKCHEERRGMFSREFIHGPVAGGSCTTCHDPHASRYDHILKQPVPILCYSCHVRLEAETNEATVHPPYEQGRCTACHDPHATNNRWVLVKNSQELCTKCHRPDGDLATHKHPYNVPPKRKLRTPLKLTAKGELECLSCHYPHAGDSEHLLRITERFTCRGCHEEKL